MGSVVVSAVGALPLMPRVQLDVVAELVAKITAGA